MGRLSTLKPRVQQQSRRLESITTKEQRTTGRALQTIRMAMWLEDPHCARCGKWVGCSSLEFEVDHIIPLHKGGTDTKDNRQILCVDRGDIEGCHTIKTREDLKS